MKQKVISNKQIYKKYLLPTLLLFTIFHILIKVFVFIIKFTHNILDNNDFIVLNINLLITYLFIFTQIILIYKKFVRHDKDIPK